MNSDIIEISSLDLNDNFDAGWSKPKSSNFGGGLELLMNDKAKEGNRPTSDIDLDDLNNLENGCQLAKYENLQVVKSKEMRYYEKKS